MSGLRERDERFANNKDQYDWEPLEGKVLRKTCARLLYEDTEVHIV